MNRDVEDTCFDESGEYEFDEDDLRRIEAWEKIVKCTRRDTRLITFEIFNYFTSS